MARTIGRSTFPALPKVKLGARRRGDVRGAAFRVAVGLLIATLGASTAQARPTRIAWSTYMRTGPGSGYDVIDELRHDTLVDLGACGPRWCKIASGPAIGFVDRDALALPHLPLGGAPAGRGQGCFVAGQYAWRHPAPTRFCQVTPGR